MSEPVPNSHSTRTVETALALREVTRVMPETAFAASSIGRLTSRSTTSGAAPGSTEMIVAAGVSIEGMSSCLRLLVANSPRPIRIAQTSRTTVRLARLSLVSRVTWTDYVRLRRALTPVSATRAAHPRPSQSTGSGGTFPFG